MNMKTITFTEAQMLHQADVLVVAHAMGNLMQVMDQMTHESEKTAAAFCALEYVLDEAADALEAEALALSKRFDEGGDA